MRVYTLKQAGSHLFRSEAHVLAVIFCCMQATVNVVETKARSRNAKKTKTYKTTMRNILLPSVAAAEAAYTPSSLTVTRRAQAMAATRIERTRRMRTATSLNACTNPMVNACSAC